MRFVIDSSAVLAVLGQEPGADLVEPLLAAGLVSSVNIAEITAKLVERGASPSGVRKVLLGLPCSIAPVDENQGFLAGEIIAETRHMGVSLGDSFCLALARCLGAPVLTADRVWADLDLGIDVTLIR